MIVMSWMIFSQTKISDFFSAITDNLQNHQKSRRSEHLISTRLASTLQLEAKKAEYLLPKKIDIASQNQKESESHLIEV